MDFIRKMLKNKALTGASIFVISTFIQRGLSLITTPIYTRLLSSYDYGIVSTYNTWYGVLSVIFTLSIAANAFNTGLVKYKADRDGFVSNMISLTAFLVLCGFSIITILRVPFQNLSGLEYKYYVIMFINMFFDVVYGFWGLCSKFDEKYIKYVIANLSLSALSILTTIVSLLTIDGDSAFVKILSGSIINCIFAAGITINYIRKAPTILFNKYWKFALLFCIPLIPHYMSNHLLNQADRIMITSMCGADKTGIYTIAYKMPEILNICWTCVSAVYVPWLYKKLDNGARSEVRKVNTILMTSISFITLSIILLGPEVMKILATQEYQEGKYIVPALVVGYYGLFICLICSHIELFYKKNKFITLITLSAAIVNIGLNYLLIPRFGYMAAAYTTYIGYAIMLALHAFNMKRTKLIQYVNMKLLVLLFIFNTIVGIGMLTIYDNTLIRYIILFAIFFICLLMRKRIICLIKKMKEA